MSDPDSEPNPSDTAQPKPYAKKFKARQAYTQFVDPCEDAAKASLDCMSRNDYKRSACIGFFEAYKDCKKAWTDQRKADRRAGKEVAT